MTNTENPESMVSVRGLNKVYESSGRRVEAIGDITFEVPRGDFTCIVGPSGAGKTTLLKCLAGLLGPTAGEVLVEGKKVTGPPPGMAVVFQEYGRSLFPWKSVKQNVELPLKQKGLARERRRELVAQALTAVGLADAGDSYPWQLSGGMQQRVAIARAVAYEPHVLLMDEPFAAVDAQTRAELEDLVRSLWKTLGVTTLFVTHDVDEAVYLGRRVLVLSSSPTRILDDIDVDLPAERDQVDTRSSRRFAQLRARVHHGIQAAKAGHYTLPTAAAETHSGPVDLGYRIDGSDTTQPPVLLLGSLGTTLAMWEPQVDRLKNARKVISVDLRGHGASPAPSDSATLDDLVADVVALLDRLAIPTVDAVGLSLGGTVLTALAAAHPERVSSLATINAPVFADKPEFWEERADLVASRGTQTVAEGVIHRWYTPATAAEPGDLIRRTALGVAAIDRDGYAACCRAIARADLRPQLTAITIPVLAVSGQQDAAVPGHHARILAETAPSASQVELDSAHLLNQEVPDELHEALVRHWAAAHEGMSAR